MWCKLNQTSVLKGMKLLKCLKSATFFIPKKFPGVWNSCMAVKRNVNLYVLKSIHYRIDFIDLQPTVILNLTRASQNSTWQTFVSFFFKKLNTNAITLTSEHFCILRSQHIWKQPNMERNRSFLAASNSILAQQRFTHLWVKRIWNVWTSLRNLFY